MEYVVKRNIQPWLVDLMGTFAAVEVTGARQVGKTTLAEMVSRHLDVEALMLTLDDPEVLGLAQSDPRGFIEQGRGKVLIIDEFQRAPQLVLPLKAAIDRDRTPGQFIITGSSRMASTDSADSLAGRVINCELRGFSQGEIRGVKEDFVARVLAGLKPSEECSDLSRSDYVDILCRGSMPEVQKLDPRMMEAWFRSFLDRVAAKDLQDIGGLSDSRRVLSLLRAIAATQGSEIVVGRMANLANIPATTAAEYVSLLRQVFLVDVIAPWAPNLLKREVGKTKMVVNDSGIGIHLAGMSAETLKDLVRGQALGGFLEAFIAGELLRQRTWSAHSWSLSHYRSPDGREVDLIIELADGVVIALEVKAASTVQRQDFRHLEWLREKLGDRFIAGIVVTTDAQGRMLGPRLYSIPVASLWRA